MLHFQYTFYLFQQLNELLREGKLEVDDAGALMMPAVCVYDT